MIPVKQLLRRYALRPKRSMGQHFLTDPAVVTKILRAARLGPCDIVVEIGAGLGALTIPAARLAKEVVAIEYDPAVSEALREETRGIPGVEVVTTDAMKFSFTCCAEARGCKLVVLGNLPYLISTPIIFKLLEEKGAIRSMTLMFQREVAARLAAKPGSKDYGSLSVGVQYGAMVRSLGVVPSRSFYPRPGVDSAVVHLVPLEVPVVSVASEATFFKVVKASFGHRRKTVENSMVASGVFGLDRDQVKMAFFRAGIDPRRRGESLSLEEFARLADAVYLAEKEGDTPFA